MAYGTTISITLSKTTFKYLCEHQDGWDWFCLDSPVVSRKIISKKEITLPQSRTVPGIDSLLDGSDWHRTVVPGFDDVIWTYTPVSNKPLRYSSNTSLICNGIVITDHVILNDLYISKDLDIIDMSTPSVVVFDQDGRLPINLERTDLVGRSLPFSDELTEDLSSFLAHNILSYINTIKTSDLQEFLSRILEMSAQGLGRRYTLNDGVAKLLICGNSLLPIDLDLLEKSQIESIFIDPSNLGRRQGAWTSNELRRICSNYWITDKLDGTKGGRSTWVRRYFEINDERSKLSKLPICGRRMLINKADIDIIVSPGYVPKTFWNRLTIEWENEEWGLYSIGNTPPFEGDLNTICTQLEASSALGFSIIYLDWNSYTKSPDDRKDSPFSKAWLKANNGKPLKQVSPTKILTLQS